MTILSNGTILNSRYRIIGLIAEGGFGAVYRAEDQNLRRPCAVKENKLAHFGAQQQFIKEATLLAGLNHPSLPRVTDRFDQESRQYLVMDYISGRSLQDLLGQISPYQAVEACLKVADAVDYLHRQTTPIFHRDIKPANIIMRHDSHIMLVDFGIAYFQDQSDLRRQVALAVTEGYSPPEQYDGVTDARSDIYALGATLYALIAGRQPPIVTARLKGEGVDLRLMPAPLRIVLATAIDMAPYRRYTTMSDFGKALSQALHQLGESVD